MKIEYTVPLRRLVRPRPFTSKPAADEPQGRPHRIARVVALAHRLDELVRSGAVRDYGELARVGHVSPARICQFLTLLHLAPAIQEHLLFTTAGERTPITESALQPLGFCIILVRPPTR